MTESATNMRAVQLPADLCAAAEKKFALASTNHTFAGQTFANPAFANRGFANLEELLTFVLQELLRDEGAQFDQAEQRLVEERLRELGYL